MQPLAGRIGGIGRAGFSAREIAAAGAGPCGLTLLRLGGPSGLAGLGRRGALEGEIAEDVLGDDIAPSSGVLALLLVNEVADAGDGRVLVAEGVELQPVLGVRLLELELLETPLHLLGLFLEQELGPLIGVHEGKTLGALGGRFLLLALLAPKLVFLSLTFESFQSFLELSVLGPELAKLPLTAAYIS